MSNTERSSERSKLGWLARLVPILFAGGCLTQPGLDEVLDDEIIATGYDTDVAFDRYQTFAVDPTIRIIKEVSDGGLEANDLAASAAKPIVDQFVKSMTGAGYVEVRADESPDLGITLSGINSLVSGTVSGWWGYGSFWGYPGWGYYYPYLFTFSYRSGSLVIEMVDLTRATLPSGDSGARSDNDKPVGLPVVWNAVAYRVLDANVKPDLRWAKAAIIQAFRQSPYLRRE